MGLKRLPKESMGCKTKLLSGQGQVLGCWVFGFVVFFAGGRVGGREGVLFTRWIWVCCCSCLVFNNNSPWN